MCTHPRLSRLSWLFVLVCLNMMVLAALPPAQQDDEFTGGLSGPALQRLTVTQRKMAVMMHTARMALDRGEAPDAVAKTFYTDLAALKLESPMVDLNRLKTRLSEVSLADAALGDKFGGGGTPVERALLVYRREVTMDCIRAAVAEVARTHGTDATGSVYLAKIGKWSIQNPDMFTLAGDIDFSFMGARPEVILALRDAYVRTSQDRMKMNMVAIDSVATAHGFAEHMVYMGIQGRKFADDAMMGMAEGVEQIDMRNPDSVGTPEARQLSGKQAVNETVLEETAIRYREEGHEARSRSQAAEIEKTWKDRLTQSVEPMLSMEMARHLEHDIIRNVDVFAAIDIVKKGAKYLRRSNDQIATDLKIKPASPDWHRFVKQVDEMAKDASAEEMTKFIDTELKRLGEPGLFKEKFVDGKVVGLEPHAGGAEKFLGLVKQTIWKNVGNGLDTRIRAVTDAINVRGRAAGIGTPDDLRPERVGDTIRMLVVGLDVMLTDHSLIPADILQKMSLLTKVLEGYARQRAFALPEADLKKMRELLREAAPNEKSLLLIYGAWADQIDKFVVRQYDTLAATLPDSIRSRVTIADAKIDAINSALDYLDNTTMGALRDTGVLALDVSKKGNYGVGWADKPDGSSRVYVTKFPRIAAINQRLNASILGRIGNNTAFKTFNLAQEADAYYAALMQASTPWEAFQNLSAEIFRRRVPGFGAVEAYYMGNYLRMSVEVVYLIFPPLAIPEGLYGIAMSVYDKYTTWWWSSELEHYVDTFYKDAEFKLVTTGTGQQIRRYQLTAITINTPNRSSTYDRASIETGTADFLNNPEINKVLWENISQTDPFIQLMEELKKHEAAGRKVRAHFQRQIDEHWAKVRVDFGKNLIKRFEDRKASEKSIKMGEAPQLYADLVKVADALEIRDSLLAAMDREWDSSYLQRLWVWLKAEPGDVLKAAQDVLNEAPPEAEKTRAVTILRKHLDAYRTVLSARTAAESSLETIFKDAKLDPLPVDQDNWRLLTRIAFLRCAPDQDVALAGRLRNAPATTLESVRARMDVLINTQAPGAKREKAFDQEIAAQITGQLFWIQALRATQVPVIRKVYLNRAIAAHAETSDSLFAKFIEHYMGQTGALMVRVYQWIDGAESEQPVVGATLALTDTSGKAPDAVFSEISNGFYQAIGVKPGQYILRVSAPGFVTRTGDPQAQISQEVGMNKASREMSVSLKAAD
ncbi:MAG: carboxypeptidase-like regulatory domain-containing protein, partial [Methanosarcinaceae archaeon]|nr:carboxypeptidase-like regulatory domain-containing protein [Methanosarcinaceae archaeon]